MVGPVLTRDLRQVNLVARIEAHSFHKIGFRRIPDGEGQARSWMVAGTPVGGSTPNVVASQVVQREVGISRTWM